MISVGATCGSFPSLLPAQQESYCCSVLGMDSHGSGSSCLGLPRRRPLPAGWLRLRTGGAGVSLHATANRFMVRTNLGSQEKMQFSFLSFLFLAWLQWDWTDRHPEGCSSQLVHCDTAAQPAVCLMRAHQSQSV